MVSGWCLLLAMAVWTPPLAAQNATDTTAVTDTVLVPLPLGLRPQDEPPAPPEDLLGFAPAEPGITVGDTLLVRRAEFEPARILDDVHGSFLYDLGGYGWPHGWSPFGLAPQHVSLRMDGHTFDDLLTARPRYDLLPTAFLEPLRMEKTRYGMPMMVHAQTREFVALQPLTEFRYFTGDGGLQSVHAMHAQERDVALFGEEQEGVVAFLFGYGGHAADNEYPNSRLTRGRQTVARLRYDQVRWSLELRNFHNRRRLGAHGGVATNIYDRTFATVENPNAERGIIRNDLSATLRALLVPGLDEPLTGSLTWTSQSHTYTDPVERLTVRTHRVGIRAHQNVRAGAHRIQLFGEAWIDRSNWSRAIPREPRQEFYAGLRDSLEVLGFQAVLEGGMRHAWQPVPVGLVRLERQFGPFRWLAEATHSVQPPSRVETGGFGDAFLPVDDRPAGRTIQGHTALAAEFGVLDMTFSGALRRQTDLVDLFSEPTASDDDFPAETEQVNQPPATDVVRARIAPGAFEHATASVDIGFRRHAARGLYATVQPTFFQVLNPGASDLHLRLSRSLPEVYLRGRLGARFIAFQDLDVDLSVRGRAWTPFASRTLHSETGLLVLPESTEPAFGPSNTLDIVLEGTLFEAKIFLSFENTLSGIAFPGNFIVPVYPLPERRLRFGVWWPIMG